MAQSTFISFIKDKLNEAASVTSTGPTRRRPPPFDSGSRRMVTAPSLTASSLTARLTPAVLTLASPFPCRQSASVVILKKTCCSGAQGDRRRGVELYTFHFLIHRPLRRSNFIFLPAKRRTPSGVRRFLHYWPWRGRVMPRHGAHRCGWERGAGRGGQPS